MPDCIYFWPEEWWGKLPRLRCALPEMSGKLGQCVFIFACDPCMLCAESFSYLLGMCTRLWASPILPTRKPRDPCHQLTNSLSGTHWRQVSWALPILIFFAWNLVCRRPPRQVAHLDFFRPESGIAYPTQAVALYHGLINFLHCESWDQKFSFVQGRVYRKFGRSDSWSC
jgi:hypothetical protein